MAVYAETTAAVLYIKLQPEKSATLAKLNQTYVCLTQPHVIVVSLLNELTRHSRQMQHSKRVPFFQPHQDTTNTMKKTFTLAAALAAFCFPAAQAAEIPQSAVLQYSGSYGIPATMSFKRNGDNYTVTANINVPLYKIRFESGGKIVGNQLKPSYYNDIRNGKTYASAKFSGNTATYGRAGSTQTETVSGSVMDLFTLSWQLAFNDGKLPANLKITNGKKLYNVGGMSNAGSKSFKINGGSTSINQFNVRRGDDSVQYAFAPALNNVPAVIKYNDGDKNYNLTLKSVTINGQVLKP